MIWAPLIAIALIVALPFVLEWRRPKMNAAARRDAPGHFMRLSRGITHFRWIGPDRGPVAVCIHGLTTPSFVWWPIASGLARAGYRVLIYDLYGRGYSDRPTGPQDAAFFVTQLEELLDSQNIDDDITLLGYSMGGAIATSFAARFPGRLRQLALLAPAGFGHDLGPVAKLVTDHKRLGTWLMLLLYGRSYGRALEAERDLSAQIDNIVDLQLAELGWRGFRPAVLASMRGMLDGDQEEEHRQIGLKRVPVLAIWGRNDEVIPVAGLDKLADWNSAARHEVIEDASHALAYTHSDQVLGVLPDAQGESA